MTASASDSATPGDIAIRCVGLTKRFGQVTAVDGLDLSVPPGKIVGFLGPNGAGKTTTLRILAGLSRATSGEAWIAGAPVALHARELQSRIGYLPDMPSFYGWMSGREYLRFVGDLFGLPKEETRRRSEELLELVDLTGAAGRRVGGYSRGMKQRLGIAQALMNRPQVLLMDEPSSALDPAGRLEVVETMLRLKEQRTTIFLSTHILADAERVCDEVAIIDRGRLLAQATVEGLRETYATPAFEIEFDEAADGLLLELSAQPWIERVESGMDGANNRLRVTASDASTARRELPKAVAASGLTLRRYETLTPTLEEVFIRLTKRQEARA
jgi:ABC-2 type transport system ATP-binding protein